MDGSRSSIPPLGSPTLLGEKLLTFSEAAAILPRFNGKKVHHSTIWRWARKGVRGVLLEVRRVGRRFVTTAEALDRFGSALASLGPDRPPPWDVPPRELRRTMKQRERSLENARAVLEAAGVLEPVPSPAEEQVRRRPGQVSQPKAEKPGMAGGGA